MLEYRYKPPVGAGGSNYFPFDTSSESLQTTEGGEAHFRSGAAVEHSGE